MKNLPEPIEEVIKASSYSALLQHTHLSHQQFIDAVADHLPKLHFTDKETIDTLLREEDFFLKLQKYLELQQEISGKIMELEQRKNHERSPQSIEAVNKKITRAALARRHEKNQEEMRKDQIFVRLIPKSQSCIQFMLCNRNFPRMEVKLSCNQHLEYLVNYLTNKWIRGKVGYKVVLYPDNSFLKVMPMSEKEKALKEPLNNYLMFTDIMNCCGVNQNGVLNMTYEIVQTKKSVNKQARSVEHLKESNKIEALSHHHHYNDTSKAHLVDNTHKIKTEPNQTPSLLEKGKGEEKPQGFPVEASSPVKYSYRDELMPQSSLMFNKNSNFFANNEESMFGSLGFNFNFGVTHKKDDPLFSFNSNHYFDSYFPDARKNKEEKLKEGAKVEEHFSEAEEKSEENNSIKAVGDKKENSRDKENGSEKAVKEEPDKKLDKLMNLLEQVDKEKACKQQLGPAFSEDPNNSNKFKDVKTVSILKKRAANT